MNKKGYPFPISDPSDQRRYYSLDAYLKLRYGKKIHKLSIDGGFTCPNRDGTISENGCVFCSEGGSGDFSYRTIEDALTASKEFYPDKKETYIIYFQAFTNTYAPLPILEKLYRSALDSEYSVGISIGTRPDCITAPICELLKKLNREYPHKFIWVELGLQTIHDSTAIKINRGYLLPVFDTAVLLLQKAGIKIVVHLIIGLPGESESAMKESVQYMNKVMPFGLKLHLLHILNGTALYDEYQKNPFSLPSLEEYTDLLQTFLEIISPKIVIHRLTGDGPADLLVAPLWSRDKKKIFNMLHYKMKFSDSYQGKYFRKELP